MAVLNLDYYTEKDFYSDGDVEDEILDIVRNNIDIDALEDKKYPILYHLSDVRANIINWYPFDEGASALEIGAGCGAITGALCSKLGHVVSVELSKRRATINYERHKTVDNLDIYVGNLNDMHFGQKFDYAILNGVLEYAGSFTNTEHPYADFLRNIREYLTDDGKIIIAIENKYGLKYFAGAPEDHTDSFFLGLNDYDGNPNVRTFAKSELEQLLRECGLSYIDFYYPYPDYKFPNEIFTADTLKECGYGKDYYNLNGDRYLLFDEVRVARGLVNENVMDVFSNSFLVVASACELKKEDKIIYAKVNNDRHKQFKIMTTISESDSGRIVRKKPISESAAPHIEAMIRQSHRSVSAQSENSNGMIMENVPSDSERDYFEYRYIEQPTLTQTIKEYIRCGYTDKIIDELCRLFMTAFPSVEKVDYATEEFRNVFGTEVTGDLEDCISDVNIDLICDNVFKLENKYVVIDCEWVFPFYIPVSFVKWRTINELYCKCNSLNSLITKAEMLKCFGIPEDKGDVFAAWNYYFCEKYVGANALEEYSFPKDMLFLYNIMDHIPLETKAHSYLYVDNGEGFAEELKVCSIMRINNGSFEVKFEIPSNWHTKHIRWDIMKNTLIWAKITDIRSDADIQIQSSNGYQGEDESVCFMSYIPHYEMISNDVEIRQLCITGTIKYMGYEELEMFNAEYRENERRINELTAEINRLTAQNNELNNTFFRSIRRVLGKIKSKRRGK